MGLLKKLSLLNKGLKYKLLIAFSLMSIIPLLALTYIISVYLFPQLETVINLASSVILAAVIVSILGLALAKTLINPVIDMAIEAKIIANGEYDRKIAIKSDDEVGNIASSINFMTQKIRSNLDELKNYGQRMREINVEIHKKVFALSSLLQIGDILSAGSIKVDSLLELAVEKASSVFDTGFGILYMAKDGGVDFAPKVSYNLDKEKLDELVIRKTDNDFLEKALENRSIISVDGNSGRISKDHQAFMAKYGLKNFMTIPIYSGRKNLGMFIVGNRLDNFKYRDDDIELIKVFAKQMTIAIESDILAKRAKELSIKDDLTDLYNKNFILVRLEEEIKRAIFYQRPCSFIVFNLDNFKDFRDKYGELNAEEALKRVAKVIKDNMVPVGKAARIGGDEFAVLLPEKNKKEASHIAEEIRKKIGSTNLVKEGSATLTVSGGVSENPIDGATGDELLNKATEALKRAKSSDKNKISV